METDTISQLQVPAAVDDPESIARDVLAVGRIDAVPPLLKVLCHATGMGFAAVARVTAGTWTACAVQDDIGFGLLPGGQLDVSTTLCNEVRQARTPVVIDHASVDPTYCTHHTPRIYRIESYISVPIVLPGGEYFGNLCAIDPRPARVSQPHIVMMFTLFAELIAMHLQMERSMQRDRDALMDEKAIGELREQFIAILGHDLRSPLNAVAACGQLLERQSSDPAVGATVTRLMRNVRRISELIDHVVDFARGRMGSGIPVAIRDVPDAEAVFASVVSEFRDSHPDRVIQSRIEIPGTVRCDPARLQQVVSNLLANALAHGSPTREVVFETSLEGGDMLLSVWNAGEPIAAEHLGRVFHPFWRRSRSGEREGLGLGLHISAQIVAAHGGKMEVTSTPSDGTTFTARVPAGVRSPGMRSR